MRKKVVTIAISGLLLWVAVFGAFGERSHAYVDPSTMTDAAFFGVWDSSSWTTPGKIDYGYSPELVGVENAVKAGDYASAKAALLAYYAARTTRTLPVLDQTAADSAVASLAMEDIFTVGSDRYQDRITVGNSAASVSADVTSGVAEAYGENKKTAFMLMGEDKIASEAVFYSREAATNRPLLEIISGGQTYTFEAEKDTYTSTGNGTTNFGSSAELRIRESGYPYDNNAQRSYLQFDFSSLPSAPTSAVLKLHGYNETGTGDMSILVFRFRSTAWDETALNWNNTSGYTFSWRGASGSTDWLQPAAGANAEYAYLLNRFTFLRPMTYEYARTADETYAAHMIRLMLDFIGDLGDGAASYPRSLDTALRATNWVGAYDAVVGGTSLDPDGNAGLLKAMWMMMNELGDETKEYPDDTNVWEDASYHGNSNWGVNETFGLYMLAVYFPEFAISSSKLALANDRLNRLITDLNKGDGSYIEDSSSYAFVSTELYHNIKTIGELNGQTFGETFDSQLQRMGRYLMDISFPNGYDINYGDAASFDVRPLVGKIGNAYDNPMLQYFGSGGSAGTEPPYTSTAYPHSQSAVMRTGWGENDLYMHINAQSGIHRQFDMLSTILYAYGRPLLPDNGRNAYDADPVTTWLKSTQAHNTIAINNQNQNDWTIRDKLTDWTTNNHFDFYEGETSSNPGIAFRRSVLFVKPSYWIVSDYLESSSGINRYEQNWHMYPGAEPMMDATTQKARSTFSEGPNIQVVPADPAELDASLEPSYYSPSFNSVQESSRVTYVKNTSGNTTFDTVLYPTGPNDSMRDVVVARLPTAPSVAPTTATALRIDLNEGAGGNVGYYYLSHEKQPDAARSFGDYSIDGKLAYAETDASGNLVGALVKSASTLKRSDTNLIASDERITEIAVSWNGDILEISGKALKANDNPGSSIAIYAPAAATVKLNGKVVPHTKVGNYIYAVEQADRVKMQLFDASSDYSLTQGWAGWSYQEYNAATAAFNDLGANSTGWNARWQKGPSTAAPNVSRDTHAPGPQDSVRTWTAPANGMVRIRGNVKIHPDFPQSNETLQGDGVRLKIVMNNYTDNVWPSSGWQYLAPENTIGFEIDETLVVNKGDRIRFIVNWNGTGYFDRVLWAPTIAFYPDPG